MLHAFLGAMLAATSVGITARVLADAGALQTPASRIILGAAVIDDVLGLIVLAVVSGIITAAATGVALAPAAVLWIVVKAVLFLFGALFVGAFAAPRLFKASLAVPAGGVLAALGLGLCLLFSYLAALAGLAPIVGAFAAGLVLEEKHAVEHIARGEPPLEEALAPLIAFLVPIFFVRMGMLVDLSAFASWSVLSFAVVLTLAAVVGKQVCSLFAPKGVSGAHHRPGHDAAGRGRPHLRGHRCAADPGRPAGRGRGNLRRRGVHGDGDHRGHAAAAPVVPQALRLRPARDPPGRRTGGRGRSPGSTRRPRPAGRRPR